MNRRGILAPGAGLLKRGENGRDLLSRWYPARLKKRIEQIGQMRDRITFIQGDGMEVLQRCARDPAAAFFIDPPYTVAGKKAGCRLYTCFELDHRQLFDLVQALQGDFLTTYDDTQEVRTLTRSYTQTVPMRNTHHAELAELLIGSNLRRVPLAEEEPGGIGCERNALLLSRETLGASKVHPARETPVTCARTAEHPGSGVFYCYVKSQEGVVRWILRRRVLPTLWCLPATSRGNSRAVRLSP